MQNSQHLPGLSAFAAGANVLITGSSGHLGRHVSATLAKRGFAIRPFDCRATGTARGDVRDRLAVQQALQGVAGIIHLAAVSRVDDAERQPDLCHTVNVVGTSEILQAASSQSRKPWVLFVSSREVLGHVPSTMPATELSPPAPRNAYARSKLEGEQLVQAAQRQGLRACIVRLSNVFGSPLDRPERVIPTFVRQAIAGQPLVVRGPRRALDFVHVDDVSAALAQVANALHQGRQMPEILHVVSGESWPLGDLAAQVVATARSPSAIVADAAEGHEIEGFHGSHDLATRILGWRPQVSLVAGLRQLITEPYQPLTVQGQL
jgi:nucleoside-diphosphate-sugar epimerase